MSLSPPPLLLLLLPFPWMGKSVVKSSSVLSQITRKIPTKKKQGNAFLSSLDKKKELSLKNRISIDRSLDYVSGRRRRSRRGERFSFSLSVCVCVCVCGRAWVAVGGRAVFGGRKKRRGQYSFSRSEKPKEEIVEK